MPDSFTVEVKGLAELERQLNELPDNLAKGAIRTASRKAGRILQTHAQRNVAASFVKRTGTLQKGIIVATAIKPDGVRGASIIALIGLRVKPKQLSAFYGKFLEFGWVAGAKIRAATARRRRNADRGGHNILPRPFLAPAFESEKRNMLDAFVTELRKAIDRVTYKRAA